MGDYGSPNLPILRGSKEFLSLHHHPNLCPILYLHWLIRYWLLGVFVLNTLSPVCVKFSRPSFLLCRRNVNCFFLVLIISVFLFSFFSNLHPWSHDLSVAFPESFARLCCLLFPFHLWGYCPALTPILFIMYSSSEVFSSFLTKWSRFIILSERHLSLFKCTFEFLNYIFRCLL